MAIIADTDACLLWFVNIIFMLYILGYIFSLGIISAFFELALIELKAMQQSWRKAFPPRPKD